ncbi:PIN domain-containing protein [Streptomyces sp. NPDC051109]|uniref:PIN domain-containing protein n=1 Tax=Streptomyces sp. NPDC051109 TaxID=3365642 RepID=UPI0037878E3E
MIDRIISRGDVVIPAPTMAEALGVCGRRGYRRPIEDLEADLVQLGVKVEAFTEADTIRAAELWHLPPDRRRDSLSFGDAQCLAVGERLGHMIVTGDGYWELLHKDGQIRVPVLLFR